MTSSMRSKRIAQLQAWTLEAALAVAQSMPCLLCFRIVYQCGVGTYDGGKDILRPLDRQMYGGAATLNVPQPTQ